jgi:hypothetical protein
VVVAGLGASLCHFVLGVNVTDFQGLAAEMIAVPPQLINPVIAAGVEEGCRELSTRHFVDVGRVANHS